MSEVPIEMKVLMNHIYEYEKGVRRMVLYTFNVQYAISLVGDSLIGILTTSFSRQAPPPSTSSLAVRNVFDAIRLMVTRPLNELSPEEDFMLGALLGYDLTMECERYCTLKNRTCHCDNCVNARRALPRMAMTSCPV